MSVRDGARLLRLQLSGPNVDTWFMLVPPPAVIWPRVVSVIREALEPGFTPWLPLEEPRRTRLGRAFAPRPDHRGLGRLIHRVGRYSSHWAVVLDGRADVTTVTFSSAGRPVRAGLATDILNELTGPDGLLELDAN
jgi:hypothetical protein